MRSSERLCWGLIAGSQRDTDRTGQNPPEAQSPSDGTEHGDTGVSATFVVLGFIPRVSDWAACRYERKPEGADSPDRYSSANVLSPGLNWNYDNLIDELPDNERMLQHTGDPFTHNPSVLTHHRGRQVFNNAGLSIAKQQTDEMLDLFLTPEGSGGGGQRSDTIHTAAAPTGT